MSKTEKAKHLSTQHAESKKPAVRSTSEQQNQGAQLLEETQAKAGEYEKSLSETVESLAQNLARLSVPVKKNLKSLSEKTEESTAAIQQASKSTVTAAKRAESSVSKLEQAAQRLSWKVALVSGICGLLTGVVLLTALLIWQPHLIEALWAASQRLK